MDSAIQKSAKDQIRQLIEKYHQVINSNKLKGYTEEETKKDFVQPLFVALGWDVSSKQEVTAEESQSSGRVDYGFYLEGRIKFYLEAKPLRADIQNEDYAKQAIRYSWNKGVDWAVLTDFESLKVFYCQDPTQSLFSKLLFEIRFDEYIDRFDQLLLLSKDSFKTSKLDSYAQEHGKKKQKISVGDQLYKHLNECREILIEKLGTWNDIKDQNLLDEGVQRLLDRLIFIRVAEDRGIEPPTLIPLVRAWQNDKKGKTIYESMIGKCRELDAIYNSNLFTEHPFEKWDESPGVTENVIEILQGKAGYYEYDFKAMPADVLGAVYENYLGHMLAESEKGTVLDKNLKKRKEQGIYYTPEFIVDYIVKNTLKPVLDKCQSVNDLKKIKVLDPACGSGSFLIKALEVINEKYKEFNYKGDEMTKIMILQENLFGVDLDEQAVEIARLNLLINALEQKGKLPPLDKNIKSGNSLISGTDDELEKYFGKNFRDKKPFNWQEEFSEVFKQGGFDVIIGNPPWGADIDEEVKYFEYKYPESTKSYKDIYKIFMDKAISLLRPSGRLGFVVPNTFLYQPRYMDIKSLIDKYNYYVINLGEKIFENVQLPSCILILDKKIGEQEFVLDLTHEDRQTLSVKLSQLDNKKEKLQIKNNVIKKTDLILDDVLNFKDAGINYQAVNIGKAQKGSSKLSSFLFYEGKKEKDSDIEYWKGSNINRYFIEGKTNQFVRSDYKSFIKGNERVILNRDFFGLKPKLIWRQTASSIIATIDSKGVWFGRSVIGAVLREKYKNLNIGYILAIFNSKYFYYLYKLKVSEAGKVFPQVKLQYLRNLPFVIVSERQRESLSSKAKEIIRLYKEFYEIPENSNKWNEIKSEIEKLDRKIDEEVYKLYGLTPKETEIVEGN